MTPPSLDKSRNHKLGFADGVVGLARIDVAKSASHQQSQGETWVVRAPQFGEISNSVGSVSTANCTFKGVSIPRALHSDRNSSTVAGANPE